ncbi:hypothetical protein HZ326_16133 [Fusarium oxysporum f. sp. albedinis]|nr:hypothetical protein HZ326_16133 [Fusarium oxysporum f. sp. albedinis]
MQIPYNCFHVYPSCSEISQYYPKSTRYWTQSAIRMAYTIPTHRHHHPTPLSKMPQWVWPHLDARESRLSDDGLVPWPLILTLSDPR